MRRSERLGDDSRHRGRDILEPPKRSDINRNFLALRLLPFGLQPHLNGHRYPLSPVAMSPQNRTPLPCPGSPVGQKADPGKLTADFRHLISQTDRGDFKIFFTIGGVM